MAASADPGGRGKAPARALASAIGRASDQPAFRAIIAADRASEIESNGRGSEPVTPNWIRPGPTARTSSRPRLWLVTTKPVNAAPAERTNERLEQLVSGVDAS